MIDPDAILDRLGAAFDLDGLPMSLREWVFEYNTREEGRGKVEQIHLPNGYYISTVWLGLNHRFGGGGPPLTYESMVFLDWGDGHALDQVRYATEEEARAGHERLVHRWRQKKRRKWGEAPWTTNRRRSGGSGR